MYFSFSQNVLFVFPIIRVPDFFTNNYSNPIIEDGVLLRDMIYLKKK